MTRHSWRWPQIKTYLMQPTVLFGLTMIVVLWLGLSLQIGRDYIAARTSASDRLTSLASAFEEHVNHTLREQDEILNAVIRRFQEVRRTQLYATAISQPLPDPAQVSDVAMRLTMLDKNGAVVAMAPDDQQAGPTNYKDAAFFVAQRANSPEATGLSKPTYDRWSGRWSVLTAKRVPDIGGTFGGVIVSIIDPDVLAALEDPVQVDDATVITLSGADGIIRAITGKTALRPGANIGATDLMHTTKIADSVYAGDLDGSGTKQLYARREISGQQLFVSVALPMSTVYASADTNAARHITAGIIITLLILAAMVAGIIHHQRIETARLALTKSKRHAQRKSQELAQTLESMGQGIIMVDRHHKIVVTNENFMRLLNLPDEMNLHNMDFNSLVDFLKSRGEYDSLSPEAYQDLDSRLRATGNIGSHTNFERTRPDGTVLAVTNQELPDGGFVRTLTDITEQRCSEKKITHLARHDTLTNLANRAVFRERLEDSFKALPRTGGFGVLFLDLDNFKMANDTHGHAFGDELLKAVANRLRTSIRQSDTIARLGGDEFAIILNGLDTADKARNRAKHLINLMRAPHQIEGQRITLTVSVGCALAPGNANTSEDILKNADLALYKAKAEGRNTYRLFSPDMAEAMNKRRQLEDDLRLAATRGEFELHYQPLNRIADGRISGFEALLRWNHPTQGRIPPSDFIPIAEDSGLILTIGEWALQQACQQAAGWDESTRIAVNLSPVQFRDPKLISKVKQALQASCLAPTRLELEITETVMMQTGKSTVDRLKELRDLGIKISMDDFGTGYSSLSYLRLFSFDKIKIDRSFIHQLENNDECKAIIAAVIALADGLHVRTTAEGVETTGQLTLLAELGCEEAQGYLFSPPCPADEIPALIQRESLIPDILKSVSDKGRTRVTSGDGKSAA